MARPTRQEIRYEIDAKRFGVQLHSENALPRGREFKRLDPSYYVGWMYEGMYRFERASDYLGFKLAAEQLQKSFDLILNDFSANLKDRTTDIGDFLESYELRNDYDELSHTLTECYSNMEENDKLWAILSKAQEVNMQNHNYLDVYVNKSWTVHRNRFHTKDKFSFLKNSIAENEAYAHSLLDSAELKLKADGFLNDKIYNGNYFEDNINGIEHYRAILYSYALDIPKAKSSYESLRSSWYFPQNNYATFSSIQGKFREGAEYYEKAKMTDAGDKRMNESYYYAALLQSYRGMPKTAISEMQNLLSANGATPGFGWYNIGLGRALLHDGQIKEADKYLQRASQFHEIHRGTTLGQSHYNFTVALNQLSLKLKTIAQIKFLDKKWWYKPSKIFKIGQLTMEKYGLQFLIVNQLAQNPERELVVYKLFSTENTVGYDEIWNLVKDFSTNFFKKKYGEFLKSDDRPIIKNYYRYYLANLEIKKSNYEEAYSYLQQIQSSKLVDPVYEKLFIAQTNLSLHKCLKKLDRNKEAEKYLERAFAIYPQIIPFSGQKLKMQLISETKTEDEKKIIKSLDGRNIDWTKDSANVKVYVTFSKIENVPMIKLKTVYKSQVVVKEQSFAYDNIKEASIKLALYIFNIGNLENSFNMAEPSDADLIS